MIRPTFGSKVGCYNDATSTYLTLMGAYTVIRFNLDCQKHSFPHYRLFFELTVTEVKKLVKLHLFFTPFKMPFTHKEQACKNVFNVLYKYLN